MSNEELVLEIQNRDDAAVSGLMGELYQQNRGLIYKIAIRFADRAELDDLMQEAYFGLCDAVQGFDAEQGVAFTTFLAPWVRQRILRYVQNNSRLIRKPVHLQEKIYKYRGFCQMYQQQHDGKQPTDAEIRRFMGMGDASYALFIDGLKQRDVDSLDRPLDGTNEDAGSLGDVLPSDVNLEDVIIEKDEKRRLRHDVRAAVDRLEPLERATITAHWLNGKSYQEISTEIGLPIGKVQQISRQGMKHLRTPAELKRLSQYIDRRLSHIAFGCTSFTFFKNTGLSSVEAFVFEKESMEQSDTLFNRIGTELERFRHENARQQQNTRKED